MMENLLLPHSLLFYESQKNHLSYRLKRANVTPVSKFGEILVFLISAHENLSISSDSSKIFEPLRPSQLPNVYKISTL